MQGMFSQANIRTRENMELLIPENQIGWCSSGAPPQTGRALPPAGLWSRVGQDPLAYLGARFIHPVRQVGLQECITGSCTRPGTPLACSVLDSTSLHPFHRPFPI